MSDMSKMNLTWEVAATQVAPNTKDPHYLYVSVVSTHGMLSGEIKGHTIEIPADYRPEDDAPFSTTPFPELRKMCSAVFQDLLVYQDERKAFEADNIRIIAFTPLDVKPPREEV